MELNKAIKELEDIRKSILDIDMKYDGSARNLAAHHLGHAINYLNGLPEHIKSVDRREKIELERKEAAKKKAAEKAKEGEKTKA